MKYRHKSIVNGQVYSSEHENVTNSGGGCNAQGIGMLLLALILIERRFLS